MRELISDFWPFFLKSLRRAHIIFYFVTSRRSERLNGLGSGAALQVLFKNIVVNLYCVE